MSIGSICFNPPYLLPIPAAIITNTGFFIFKSPHTKILIFHSEIRIPHSLKNVHLTLFSTLFSLFGSAFYSIRFFFLPFCFLFGTFFLSLVPALFDTSFPFIRSAFFFVCPAFFLTLYPNCPSFSPRDKYSP